MKQNVMKSPFTVTMDAIAMALLYLVFPIVPLYVFLTLLMTVIATSMIGRHGVSSAILLTYVLITFITTLGHASVLVLPLLIPTYLIAEAGVVTDIAVISWALLFTPLFWLAIPLATIPSVKGYGVRSSVIFVILTLLYAVSLSFMGIVWTPITKLPITNLDIFRGFASLLAGSSPLLSTWYRELSSVSLYIIAVLVILVPPLTSTYVSRLLIREHVSKGVVQVITNLAPQLVMVALLYALLLMGLSNYEVTPLLLLGFVAVGLLGYAFDKLQEVLASIPSIRRKEAPRVLPIIDSITITEYGTWARRLPKEDQDFIDQVSNTVSKVGIVGLRADLPQDKAEILSRSMFGRTRAKGFIIMGNVEYLPSDVEFFLRSHEKSLLIVVPSQISRRVLSELIDHAKRNRANIVLMSANDGILSMLRKRGIEVLSYGKAETPTTPPITGNIGETDQTSQSISTNVTSAKSEEAGTQAQPKEAAPPDNAKVSPVKTTEEVAPASGKAIDVTRALQGQQARAQGGGERREGRGKRVSNVVVNVDPVELIDIGVKSRLIDYAESSIRLRDLLMNMGLKYVSSILIVGPPLSGKTSLIKYVANHLGVQIIDYRDPSVSVIDNAVIHIPNLESAINEDPNYVRKLLSMAKTRHLVIVSESSNPWSLSREFIKSFDAVIAVAPPTDDYIDELIKDKLGVEGRDAEIVKGIIKSCPALRAIEMIRAYLSGEGRDVLCENTLVNYQEFVRQLSLK